jgi:putative transposase
VALRYIEANPLRAGMVNDLRDYPWSSYAAHGLEQANPLLSPLPCWTELAVTEAARQAHWRGWVHMPLTERELKEVSKAVRSGRPYGNADWVEAMSRKLGVCLEARPRGRPRKTTKK